MAKIELTSQKTDRINVHIHIPKEIYKEMILFAIDQDENLKDLFINAFNKVYLKNSWKPIQIQKTKARCKWVKKETEEEEDE